jgi:hypothetical protein
MTIGTSLTLNVKPFEQGLDARLGLDVLIPERLGVAGEELLDAHCVCGGRRPVYAYVGCLHPKLGRIGFIVAHAWFRRDPHGVSRCDSGGLAGCKGGFAHLKPAEAHVALLKLSHSAKNPWVRYLLKEVRHAFGALREYLRGDPRRSAPSLRLRPIGASPTLGGTACRLNARWNICSAQPLDSA